MGNQLKKLGNFALRHNKFFIGLAVGIVAPKIAAKVSNVNLPVKVEASASIDTAA